MNENKLSSHDGFPIYYDTLNVNPLPEEILQFFKEFKWVEIECLQTRSFLLSACPKPISKIVSNIHKVPK